MEHQQEADIDDLFKKDFRGRKRDKGIVMLGSAASVTKEISDFYAKNPFPNYDELEDISSLIGKSDRNAFIRHMKREIGFTKTIIEVGSGTCQLAINFAAKTNNRVIAFDPTVESLTLGRDFAQQNGITNCHFVQGDLLDDPFERESFDLVWCTGVLHHTADPKAGFRIIAKWARKRGLIVVGLYNRYGRLRTVFRQWLYRLCGRSMAGRRLVSFLDPVLRKKISREKKNAWFQDQYEHPVESMHTLDEVLDWFDEEGVEFITAYPRADDESFDFEDPLKPTKRGTSLTRFYAQAGMVFSPLGSEGGLFIVIGRKK